MYTDDQLTDLMDVHGSSHFREDIEW